MIIDFDAHAREISKLYIHTATVYSTKTSKPTNGVSPNISGRTESVAIKNKPKYKDIPCFVEFEDVGTKEAVGVIPTVTRQITLICSEEYDIPEGAIIDVTRFGHTRRFRSAGISDHLGSHQEITLKALDYAQGV